MEKDIDVEREPKRRRLSLSDNAEPEKVDRSFPHAVKGGGEVQPAHEDSDSEKEVRCGITSFIDNSSDGFSGILKQRYTDFLVNEILPNGTVLHLRELGVPKHQKSVQPTRAVEDTAKHDHAASNGETNADTGSAKSQIDPASQANGSCEDSAENNVSVITSADQEELHLIFGQAITEKISALHSQILKHPNRKPRDFNPVSSDVIPDKEARTKAHQLIRKVFASRLDTKTSGEDTIVITKAPYSVQQRGGDEYNMPRVKNKAGWDELGGEYLHFTLYKENKDTMEIIYFLASQLKVNVKSFQFSGTKDRRGVTVQRASAYRIRAEQLASIARKLRAGSKVGDFEYHSYGLELGDLGGNEFQITLRGCQFPGDESSSVEDRMAAGTAILSKRMETYKEQGFINYYGLQRFGSFSTGTHTVGMKLLKGDLKGAIDDILYFTPEAIMAAQGQSQTDLLMSSDDKARAQAIQIWHTTKSSNKALEILPKKFSAETNLIRALGFKDRRSGELTRLTDHQGALMTIPRNLRLMYVHAYQSLVWNHAAGVRWELHGSRVVAGDLVIIPKASDAARGSDQPQFDEQGEPIVLPSKEQSSDGAPTVSEDMYERARALSSEEAASGKYNIHDLVLPLPGFDVIYPENEVGQFYTRFMASEEGGGLDPYNMRRAWKDISLSGGYRKLLAKPENVSWELKKYKYPEDQLVETDLDLLNKNNQSGARGGNAPGNTMKQALWSASGQGEEQAEDKIALVLRMRLGSSTYATMALRELMKQGGVIAYKPDYGGGR